MTNHPNRSRHYRVVYGELCPAWERSFPTLREAKAFAKHQKGLGDLIFEISPILPGDGPRSLMAAIEAHEIATA